MRGHGEGTISKRVRIGKDGKQHVDWRSAVTLPDGSRQWFTGKTQAEVSAELNKAKRARDEGKPVKLTDETVGDFLQRWLEVKKGKAPKTHAGYVQLVRLYTAPIAGLKLRDVTPAHVQRLVSELAAEKPSSAQHVLAMLKAAFGLAADWGLIPTNPASKVEKPKHRPKPIEAMSVEQARDVLAAFRGHRLEAYVTFMLNTGCRPSEALALTWNRVDLKTGRVQITQSLPIGGHEPIPTKTARSNRTLPLSPSTITALQKLGVGIGDAPVFPRGDGHFADERVVYRQVQKHLKRAGLGGLSLYALRHGAATMRLAAGDSLKVISEQLGHATITTTADRYLHVSEGQLRESSDRLERALSGSL